MSPVVAGIVVVGDAGIAIAFNRRLAAILRDALAQLPVESVTDVDRLRNVLPIADVLGPAPLVYADAQHLPRC